MHFREQRIAILAFELCFAFRLFLARVMLALDLVAFDLEGYTLFFQEVGNIGCLDDFNNFSRAWRFQ